MPTSPEQWRELLVKRLDERKPKIVHFDSYYDGEHRLAFATSKFREAFGNLFSAFSDNWCGVVVDAAVERLEVQGFRFGRDENADDEAWRIWQSNNLDAESTAAFETAIATGYGYLLVSPNPDDDTTPRITVEDPIEMIVAHEPGNRRRRLAALKMWLDDDKIAYATLYLPDAIHKWKSRAPVASVTPKPPSSTPEPLWQPFGTISASGEPLQWIKRDDQADDDGFDGRNPLGAVPVIPLLNRPKRGLGRSDLLSAIPIQDAVNKLIADMIVASEFAAYRQRWAAGIEIPRDPETGQPIRKIFDAAVDRLFSTANEEARFGSFDATDLSNYVNGVEMLVQHLAAQTRTPPHYLLGQSGAFPSGESLKSTETGLVARVKRKMTVFGEALEDTLRMSFSLIDPNDERAAAVDAETIWRDPESRSEGELVDGLVKLSTIGVPRRALWERLGASPQQIARWETMATADGLRAAAEDFVRFNGSNGQGLPNEIPTAEQAGAAAAGA